MNGTDVVAVLTTLATEDDATTLVRALLERLPALDRAFAELHPYEVPELLALPVSAGLPAYLGWVAGETSDG